MDFDAQNIKSNILWRSQSFFKMREKLETIISISKLFYFKIILKQFSCSIYWFYVSDSLRIVWWWEQCGPLWKNWDSGWQDEDQLCHFPRLHSDRGAAG